MLEGVHCTETEEIVGEGAGEGEDGADTTVTEVVPATWESCALEAVMVIFPADGGAVKRPLEVMVPALAVQFTAELGFPDPWMTAVHCEDPRGATLDGVQTAEIAVMVEVGDAVMLVPQAARVKLAISVAIICSARLVVGIGM